MGCSSSKSSLPTSPVIVTETEDENQKDKTLTTTTTDKENIPTQNGVVTNDSKHQETSQIVESKREGSVSFSVGSDDDQIDIEETEEQADKCVAQLHVMFETENIDEATLLRMVVPVHSTYRRLMQVKYREQYSKILLQDLVRKGPPACKSLFEKLFVPLEEFLAVWLHRLVQTGNLLLIVELLTAWCPSTILDVKRSYAQEYKVSFDEDLKNSFDDEISPTVKVIILSLAALQRVDDTRGIEDDVTGYESDELSKGRDQIIEILTQKSYNKPQLAAIFKEYKIKYYLDILDSIDIEFEDDAQEMLTAVVNISQNSTDYFVKELQGIFEGMKPQTDRLLFLLIGRSEVDLPEIHQAYYGLKSTTFQEEIKHKYNGLTKYALRLLVNRFGGTV